MSVSCCLHITSTPLLTPWHFLQARRDTKIVTNTAAVQSAGAVPPPTAVLGFSPHPSTRSDQQKLHAPPTDGMQLQTRSVSLDLNESHAQQVEPSEHSPQVTEPTAKDYGAPWAAAAAADKNAAAAINAQTDSATQPISDTAPTSAKQPSKALEPRGQLFNASLSAPSPFTAPPSKSFGLFNSVSSQPAPFQGFGAFSSATPAANPPAAVATSTPAPSAAEPACKPAELPSLPAFPPVVLPPPQLPASISSKPVFSFGTSQAQSSADVSQALPQATQAEQATVKAFPDKPDGIPQSSDRARSLSSDVSGETAVDEYLYSFSDERSAQDRLEGLVDVQHQAADDVEGLYVFGRTADQNQREHADNQDFPVTPLQVLLQHQALSQHNCNPFFCTGNCPFADMRVGHCVHVWIS